MESNVSPNNQAEEDNNCNDDCNVSDLIKVLHSAFRIVMHSACES